MADTWLKSRFFVALDWGNVFAEGINPLATINTDDPSLELFYRYPDRAIGCIVGNSPWKDRTLLIRDCRFL